MKRISLFGELLIIAAGMIFTSCERNDGFVPAPEPGREIEPGGAFSVEQAEIWYNASQESTVTLKSTDDGKSLAAPGLQPKAMLDLFNSAPCFK
jgi:hypothetical protein